MAAASKSTSVQGPPAACWIPTVAALLLFGQVCLLGLRPALAEGRRLSSAEARMHARYTAAVDHRSALEQTLRAQRDPIYLERERKQLLAPPPARPPAMQQSARPGRR